MKLTGTMFLTALAIGSLLACMPARAQVSTNAPTAATSTNAMPHHPMMRGPSIEWLARSLNLTADQKSKVQPIMDQDREKRHQLFMDMHNGTVTRDQIGAKMQEIHDATSAQLKTILTDEQFKKWQSLSQPHHPPMMRPPSAITNSAAQSAP